MVPRLKEEYWSRIVPELKKNHGYENPMRVPSLVKVVLNSSVGMDHDRDVLQAVAEDMAKIAGQRPVLTRARKSVSNFKLREGTNLGAKVTLRGNRMYEFLERFIDAALPRIRDFRGVSASGFDGRGNFSMGIREQTIFPEIDPDRVKQIHGMDITIVTTAESDEEARDLLRLIGMPFAAAAAG
ncbi:50S ribosomal protein L5 [Kiritimatiella glycovorans]|uniref:Large ribosomal subunit protein uL5 n=1 Tax=Kiritimatiella glycovorans TaxID=1307763 RepID=A0A0G3EJI0_9BACT|nr:50S ribosomal protein L5 [Kiritimatiella glycovorans]AKJ64945.1 50S ribosomal protein L5 [Kiritimatiella glycovorans]